MLQPDRNPVLTTMWAADDTEWERATEVLRAARPGRLADLLAFWKASRGRPYVVLRGSVTLSELYRDLVFALLLKLRRDRPLVLISDATWEPDSRAIAKRLGPAKVVVPFLVRSFIRLIDGPNVRYGVLSTAEIESFQRIWGVARDRIRFTAFPHTLYGAMVDVPTHDGGYLFAGGNSLRDYPLLEEALQQSTFETHIAAKWQPRVTRPQLVVATTSHQVFVEQMAGARACVVPLVPTVRSAGQQTYLNAMALGKPVIVTEAPGVRDYIQHGVTGIIVPHDAQALRAALEHAMDPANTEIYRAMGERARADVTKRFNEYRYRESLLDAVGFKSGEAFS